MGGSNVVTLVVSLDLAQTVHHLGDLRTELLKSTHNKTNGDVEGHPQHCGPQLQKLIVVLIGYRQDGLRLCLKSTE